LRDLQNTKGGLENKGEKESKRRKEERVAGAAKMKFGCWVSKVEEAGWLGFDK